MPTAVAVSTPVPTHNRFDPLSRLETRDSSHDTPSSPASPPRPERILNGASATASGIVLSPRETAVVAALQRSDAAEAEPLLAFFREGLRSASGAEAREAIVARYEAAVAAHARESTTLRTLLLNIANTVMSGTAWRTVAGAAPGAGAALALAQLLQAVRQRSWNGVAAVLPALAGVLPTLRSVEQIDALVRSLPDALRTQLDGLHQWVQQGDDALHPDLEIRQLAPALAVAVLLWHLRSRLPAPSAPLQGLAGFIADLPRHWQRLTTLNRLGGALLAVPGDATALSTVGESARLRGKRITAAHKEQLVAFKRAFDRQQATGTAPVFDLADGASAATPPPRETSALARAPGEPQRGGPVAAPPEAPAGDAVSSAAGWFRSTWAWLTGATAATGFSQVVQQEMVAMGSSRLDPSLNQVSVETPLMDTAAPTVIGAKAGCTRRGLGFIKRHPIATVTTLLLGAGGVVYRAWNGSPPPSLSTTTLADQLAADVVALGDTWGTGLDLLLGAPEAPARRRVPRDVGDNRARTVTEAPVRVDEGQLGISPAQRDALLGDNDLKRQLRALQLWSVAVAQDLATQAGWQWVAALPTSEQELLVNQLHALRALLPPLTALQAKPAALLDQALDADGWKEGSTGLRVDLGAVTVAGVRVQQQMPLLEYCLLRADRSPAQATFLRDGQRLPEADQRTLRAFVGGNACRQLGASIQTYAASLRTPLLAALRARLVIDAVKAKSQGRLGGSDAYLRGAEIVLGYLQGRSNVESSALTYRDTLGDGTAVAFEVPSYLVLRSASTDEGLQGQVVLYRADLGSFQSFGNEHAFRQFLDDARARAGLHVVDGAIDRTLALDIVAAAPSAYRARIQERVAHWEQRQVLFQTGKRAPEGWNAGDSFVLDFKPCTTARHTLHDWADALATFGETRQEQQLAFNRLRWSPLGMAHVATDAEVERSLRQDLQSLQTHAHAAVQRALQASLEQAGVAEALPDLDPDTVWLRVGGQSMSLTAWATSGWQQHGLSRPRLPPNLGDMPGEGIALPADPQPLQPWPGTAELYAMDLTVYRVDATGTRTVDDARTGTLLDEDARRALCGMLAGFADSNALGHAYTTYLRSLANTPDSAFHAALANQVRVHSAWMIEQAHRNGELDTRMYSALMAEHATLEPINGRGSALKGVTLKDHPVNGIWALKAKGTHFVFLPGTATGDQLLDETAFARWLKEPEAEAYMRAHTAMRYHDDLERGFRAKQSSDGIVFGFQNTRGPKQVARRHIEARLADVDEMTVSQLERLRDTLVIAASVVAGISCSVASGGLCLLSTGAMMAYAIAEGADLLERGDAPGAAEAFSGAVADAVDVLNLAAIVTVLRQLARRGLSTVSDATHALHQWQRQARGFDLDGRVNAAFATSRQSLSDTGLPMLAQPLPDGGTLYRQGGRDYIEQDGQYVASHVIDGEAGRRLRMPDAPDEVGPPVEYRDGQWRRTEQRLDGNAVTTPGTAGAPGATTPAPLKQAHPWIEKVPDAERLPPEKLDEIEAVFGIRRAGTTPSPDLHQRIQDLAMEHRIQQVISDPDSLGLPGDEAITLRAWADCPVLGNGRSVETYVQEVGEWTRGARFGKGPVGMMVEVAEPGQLPTLQQLVDAADTDALLRRLGLPQDTGQEALLSAVKSELAATITRDTGQSLLSWKRWTNAQHRLPTAADNLIKHFPALTKREAESLTASDPWLAHQAVSWTFPESTSRQVADVLAQRTKSDTRASVLRGKLDSPSKIQELGSHLQSVLPDRSWKVTSDPSGQGSVLSFTRPDEKENAVRTLTFSSSGEVRRPTSLGLSLPVPTWEEGIYEQLSPTDQKRLSGPHALRDKVVEHMKDTPLVQVCRLPDKLGKGQRLVKRGLDCNPPPAISLSEHDVEQRDALGKVMQQVRERMAGKHATFSAEEIELKQLQMKKAQLGKKQATLDPEALKRLETLEQKPFGSLKNFDVMNFATYKLEDLRYQGTAVVLPDAFPLLGTAGSGNPRPLLTTDGLVEGVPVRRVLVPEAQAVDNPTLSGWYPEDYAMGADLLPVLAGRNAEKHQASARIVLTEADLRVTRPGTEAVTPISALTDDEILQLDMSHYSPALQQHVGHASLLPSNARSLQPGAYRVYQIRSCSEGKILDNWFKALSSALPDLSVTLWGRHPGSIRSLTGRLYLISEMHPCEVSCDGRLTRLMATLPDLDVTVLYRYENNGQRKQWIMDQKLNRVVDKHRSRWELEGVADGEMRGRARTEMNKAETRAWLEDDFKRRAMEEPVPRLWVPTDTNEF